MANEKRLIDANKLLELYDMGEELEEYAGVLSVPIPVIRQNIKDMPTVDAVEVVHGRWEDGDCSACGFDIRDLIDGESDFRNWVWDGLPYCPDCGAKMDGERKDNG